MTPALASVQKWDVHRLDFVFGVRRKLGRVEAATRAQAEEFARTAHGENILVTRAGGRPRRRKPMPINLGNTTRRKS